MNPGMVPSFIVQVRDGGIYVIEEFIGIDLRSSAFLK